MAFADLDLLKCVVEFKAQFYPSNTARYDLATPGTLKLIPPDNCLAALEYDYRQMSDMIFGDEPDFAEFMTTIKQMELKINSL